MDYVREVVRLAGDAMHYEQPSEKDWQAVENKLGLAFPSDYKALARIFHESKMYPKTRNAC
jgi:hypothetical protein